MNVYTYFDSCFVSEIAQETLKIWDRSWKERGWNPIVLNEESAKSHPFYAAFSQKIKSFPSVNGERFDYHAFMRWLAIANLGGNDFVVTTEPDVLNYGVNSDDVIQKFSDLDIHTNVPAMIVAKPIAMERFCAHVMSHTINENDHHEGRPHISDQNFAIFYGEPRKIVRFIPDSSICKEVFSEGWEVAPIVHYGTPQMAPRNMMPKHIHIQKLRPLP